MSKVWISILASCAFFGPGIVACTTLGVPSPQTFNQKLAAAYTADTAVLTTVTTLGEGGKLSRPDAMNIEKQADNVKEALDIARTVYATDQAGGGNKLAAAITTLTALQTYLQGVPK